MSEVPNQCNIRPRHFEGTEIMIPALAYVRAAAASVHRDLYRVWTPGGARTRVVRRARPVGQCLASGRRFSDARQVQPGRFDRRESPACRRVFAVAHPARGRPVDRHLQQRRARVSQAVSGRQVRCAACGCDPGAGFAKWIRSRSIFRWCFATQPCYVSTGARPRFLCASRRRSGRLPSVVAARAKRHIGANATNFGCVG